MKFIPDNQILRYLLVGGWNTLFGVLGYTLLYTWLHEKVNYLALLIPANILAITNAFICYKLFVFKTRGNMLREYFRFYVVYGSSMLLGFVLMLILVDGFKLNPIVAQFVGVPITIAFTYFSHRNFSFRNDKGVKDAAR